MEIKVGQAAGTPRTADFLFEVGGKLFGVLECTEHRGFPFVQELLLIVTDGNGANLVFVHIPGRIFTVSGDKGNGIVIIKELDDGRDRFRRKIEIAGQTTRLGSFIFTINPH